MKVVLALDSFKGTMKASVVCETVREGILAVQPDTEIILKPMADGGEGTANALRVVRGGEWVEQEVTGPLMGMKVPAGFAWFPETREAVVEMAAASGLTLLANHERNPMRTTTFGTGELIAAAIEKGAQRILLGVGGSATVDGGIGAAMALGWRFRDAMGRQVPPGGQGLMELAAIERPDGKSWPVVEVLCDVDNPLIGAEGAATVYGPQKGADAGMVMDLESGLEKLAQLVSETLDIEIGDLPGAGAAGGLAAGAVAFLGAKLVPGIDTIMAESGLAKALQGADWVITGEGRFDHQSLRGKVVSGVAEAAAAAGVKTAVLAGCVELDEQVALPESIKVVKSAEKPGMEREYALEHAQKLLLVASRELAQQYFGQA
jgi:glycerate kinase